METLQNLSLQFCEKCKLHYFPDIENNIVPNECKICGGILIDTGVSYEEYRTLSKTKKCPKCKRKYPKLLIKCPKCNNQLTKLSTENKKIDRQINAIREQTQEFYEKQDNLPKCPTCGSTNLNKIGTLRRTVSVGLFGLASGKIGKQWHCNQCKSDF